MKKKNIINFVYLILLLFLTLYFKFFENVYLVYKYDLENRLISNYGYCEKTSYGFIRFIDKKYKLKKNIHIINDDDNYPYSEAFIHKPKKNYNEEFIILLNYDDQKSKIDIKKYSIVEKFKNCFYLKRND